MSDKLKLGIYWAAGCGGCDVAIVDLCEDVLKVVEIADIVFWPCATDFKYKDVKSYEDGYIDVCLFNGAIRNSEQEELAHLLRAKSKILIAFGACACFGGIPGLANLTSKDEIFETVYQDTPSTCNPNFVRPKEKTIVPGTEHKKGLLEKLLGSKERTTGYELTLPAFYDEVFFLNEKVEVDYYLPGCPPTTDLVRAVVTALAEGNLPPKGSVIGGTKTLCDECQKETGREKKKRRSVERIYRPHEIKADPTKCLLDQGIICLGPATRSGCGAKCIKANMPCQGCMGPTQATIDQGAGYASMLHSILGLDEERGLSEEDTRSLIGQIKDPIGTFYRFTLPKSLIKKRRFRVPS